MSDDQKVKITVKDNGSLRVEGDFAILDVEGNEIPHEGPAAGLCRCGHSANKPFCDGSHKPTRDEEQGCCYRYNAETLDRVKVDG